MISFFGRWIFREIRNDRAWVILFILSLGLGLFGFLSLETFRTSMESNLKSSARGFLSADLTVSSRRQIREDELARIREKLGAQSESHLTEFFSMASAQKISRLVQVKAVDLSYPFYGEIKLRSGKKVQPGMPFPFAGEPEVVVDPEVLGQMKLKVGETLQLGKQQFRILDVIEEDATQTFRMAGLAPKIYLSRTHLQATGLVEFGSTVSDVYLFHLPQKSDDELKQITRALEAEFADPNLQFSNPLEAAQDSSRAVQNLIDYLGLVSLVALGLAMMGLGYLIQLFFNRRIVTLSLLKTLGMSQARAEFFILVELLILSLAAILVVLPLCYLMFPLLDQVLVQFLPQSIELKLTGSTVMSAVALAMGWPLLLTLPMLQALRRIQLKQVLLDKELSRLELSGRDLFYLLPSLLLFYGLAIWVSHSLRTASLFVLCLFVSIALLVGLSGLLLRRLPQSSPNWILKQGFLKLKRSPFRFSVVIVSLSFGSLLIALISTLKGSLAQELISPDRVRVPSLFVFDIQDEQKDEMVDWLKQRGLQPQNLSPMIRARILSVNGKPFERRVEERMFQTREEEREARFRNRGVNLTERADLTQAETIVEGRPFSTENLDQGEISVEAKYSERLGLQLGDTLVFDIQGVEVQGRIVNKRSVKWNSFQPNFFLSLRQGPLAEAPKTWLLSLPKMPEDQKEEIQSSLVEKFPNLSAIDVSRLSVQILKLTDQMALALTLMALMSIAVGTFVLWTVLSLESERRLIEWNLMRVMGADLRAIFKLGLIENFILSGFSGLMGTLIGLSMSGLILRLLFEVPVSLAPISIALSLVLPMVLSFLLTFQFAMRMSRSQPTSLLGEGRL